MVKYLLDKKEIRDIILLYSARTEADIAYKGIFEEARQAIGLHTIYTISDDKAIVTKPNTISGFITGELIKQTVPDYLERVFYISGAHSMVVAMQDTLADAGVSRHNIKTDYFSGYA
jgi:ferredoxin-NADP reductase